MSKYKEVNENLKKQVLHAFLVIKILKKGLKNKNVSFLLFHCMIIY